MKIRDGCFVELAYELRGSRECIETELGRPCHVIAYPYGENDERVRKAAKEAGYLAGYSLAPTGDPADSFGLPRVGIYRGDGTLRFRVKTSRLQPVATSALNLFRRPPTFEGTSARGARAPT